MTAQPYKVNQEVKTGRSLAVNRPAASCAARFQNAISAHLITRACATRGCSERPKTQKHGDKGNNDADNGGRDRDNTCGDQNKRADTKGCNQSKGTFHRAEEASAAAILAAKTEACNVCLYHIVLLSPYRSVGLNAAFVNLPGSAYHVLHGFSHKRP